MVVPKLIGRTGNQAFEIATAIAYAKRNGMDYHIPAHTENDKVWPPNFTDLENANYNPFLSEIEINEFQHNYSEIPFENHYKDFNVILRGYWQSALYFEKYRTEVLDALAFADHYYIGRCSLHVRRADYLLYKDKHPPVTEVYLNKAINYILHNTGVANFHVFSDDIEWCKNFLEKDVTLKGLTFSFSENNNPLDDLYSISQCEHHIIANSSFSWWGAWACSNENKVVVSPSKNNWFGYGNSMLSTETLIPDSWIQIAY